METANVTIRMDKDLKRQAETIFDEMGMNMTTAVTIFAKTVVRQGKIPFEISVDPLYSMGMKEMLLKSLDEPLEGMKDAGEVDW